MQTIQEESAASATLNVDYSDTYKATIQRYQETDPWGIRVHGGSDLNEPITVHQVRRKSPASKAGVKEGDLLSYINNQPTDGMTHQQIADIFACPLLTLQLILTRQTPVHQPTEQDDVIERNRHYGSSSHRSHKVQPFNNLQMTSLTLDSSKRQAVYDLAHRVHLPQTVKSYQPFDFLNTSGTTRTSASEHRKVYQVSATGQQDTDWYQQQPQALTSPLNTDSDSSFTQPSPQVITQVDLSSYDKPNAYQKPKQSRVRRDDDIGVVDTGEAFGPPRQSKSFMLIATALSVQGAGETGLPPPRSATLEQVRALETQHQLQTEWL